MSVPGDVIGRLAQMGLSSRDIWQAVYYLQHGTHDTDLSPAATSAIQHLAGAGLDSGGVNRVVNYLSTGQDPDGDQERAQQAAQPAPAPQQAAAPQPSLAVSPAWLAFRRSLGIEDATDAATTQQQVDALNQRAGIARADTLESGVKARQGIADSHEARGLFRSGARLKGQAEQQTGEAKALSDMEANLSQSVAGLTQSLAQRRAERERKTSEAGLDTAYNESQRGY